MPRRRSTSQSAQRTQPTRRQSTSGRARAKKSASQVIGPPSKADVTRQHIFAAALALFRRRGFDHTSMRDIAVAADLSLGAAYYYFPTKETIVLRYYEQLHQSTLLAEAEALPGCNTLRERLMVAFTYKLQAVRADERILLPLCRVVADPKSPLSLFAPETKHVRDEAIASFARAIAPDLERLAPAAQKLLPNLLWGLYLGVVLYYFHDRSSKHHRTTEFLDGLLDLLALAIPMAGAPQAVNMFSSIYRLSVFSGLLPPAR